MKESAHVIPVCNESHRSFVTASRQLRRKIGARAPSAVELIQFELQGRNPADIVATYLDYLRDAERSRQTKRGVRRVRVLPAPDVTWPARLSPSPVKDPSRN
ncbi:MAG: hypothetical protein Q8M02_00930 [Candidatus Didemnitutus sp.]|nr:hypothetical protein [Candidatus Didemnitutus sp.]